MAVLSTVIAAASLAAGVAGTAVSYSNAKKKRKAEEARLNQAKIEAKEAARLRTGTEMTGAKVKLGAVTEDDPTKSTTATKGTASRQTRTGVGGFNASAAKIGGL